MKPRLVFVHGIGAPRDADADREEWLRALAEGARAAGHARRLSGLTGHWAADARFAYYGDLFSQAGAQGAGDGLSDADDELIAQLMLEVVDAQLAEHALDGKPQDSRRLRVLRHARAQLAPVGAGQGIGSGGRRGLNALTTLMSVPGLRWFGERISAQATFTIVGQVARYLNRAEPDARGATLDHRIRERVSACLAHDGPTIVIAHSLGTVVTLETLHAHRGPVPLLVTLGSPLGVRTAVLPRTRPQPVRAPESVGRWLNFWDRDDVIAARPRLEEFVRPNSGLVLPVSRRVDSDGAWVHPAAKYLAQPAVAGPLVEALDILSGR
ncbi:alpha/beta hydrolase [Streptomyces sp. G1]|nr:alpha/beta hydrolase [Streptomyces sp. G1]